MRVIGLLLCVIANFSFADISASCKNESGNITCSARESDTSFADMKCQQQTDGQTTCKGSYQDLSSIGLDMSCNHLKNGNVKCSGGTENGYKFSMSCTKKSINAKNMDCSISDNLGSSLSLNCGIDSNGGMPNCFGTDNNGEDVSVNCLDDGTGNPSCKANIK